MRVINTTIYNFNELSKEAQENAISNNTNIQTDSDWFEPIIEGFLEDMQADGHDIKGEDIGFSGFHSQGDGACFTTRRGTIDILSIAKKSGISISDELSNAIKSGEVTYEIYKISNRYHHSNTVTSSINCSEKTPDKILIEIVNIDLKLLQACREIMDSLYADLEKYYNELTSDESIKEYLINEEIEFYESGEIFSE